MRTGRADILRPADRTGLKRDENNLSMKTNFPVNMIQKHAFSKRKFSKDFRGLRHRTLVLLIDLPRI